MIGSGAMGASLAAIVAPHVPTVIVVRNPERDGRIRRAGIQVEGALAAFGRPDVVGSIDDLADIHPIDLVFVATKTTAIPSVCEAMRPHRKELPCIVSYQNGIEPGRTIIRLLGTPNVVRMVINYGGSVLEPATATGPYRVRISFEDPPHFVGGEPEVAEFARALAPELTRMGLVTEFVADIDREVWRKGILNAASNPVSALVRAPIGDLMASPARPLIERLLTEAIAVARGAGIDLGDGFQTSALDYLGHAAAHMPSMAEDVISGRPTEITQLNEQISARGRALAIATPTHDAIVDLIRTFDWRAETAMKKPSGLTPTRSKE
ncbi:MAG: ketopantoate reductase family protein [Candidatus Binatia bacterium]